MNQLCNGSPHETIDQQLLSKNSQFEAQRFDIFLLNRSPLLFRASLLLDILISFEGVSGQTQHLTLMEGVSGQNQHLTLIVYFLFLPEKAKAP